MTEQMIPNAAPPTTTVIPAVSKALVPFATPGSDAAKSIVERLEQGVRERQAAAPEFKVYQRPDHDKIWVREAPWGPEIVFERGLSRKEVMISQHDLATLFRVVARSLKRDFALVPLVNVGSGEPDDELAAAMLAAMERDGDPSDAELSALDR